MLAARVDLLRALCGDRRLQRLDGPLDGDEAARIACLSRYHFILHFRALTGHSPQLFHLRLRMQRAAWSLASTHERGVDIALAAGFATTDGFASAFHRAAVTVSGRVDTPEDIEIGAIPAMTWAMSTHKGSHAGMTDSFMRLGVEIRRRKDLVHVPLCSLEIYLSDPDNTPESELLTKIGFPVVTLS